MKDRIIKPWDEIFNVPSALAAIKYAKDLKMRLAEWVAYIFVDLARENDDFNWFTILECYEIAEDIRQAAIKEAREQVTELENMGV